MAADNLKIAIIGAGFISQYHVDGLRAAGGADVCCVVGRRAEPTRLRAMELGIDRAETDLSAILSDDSLNAVVIASPDGLHKQQAIAAMRAGKAVLLQKPMALDTSECRQILDVAAETGKLLTVSFMHRYFPEVRWLRRLVAEGRLGAIHSVRIRNATPGADWASWFYSPGQVAGGVVMQLGVHGIDLCQHLFGEIREVSAMSVTAAGRRKLRDGQEVTTDLEDNVAASYRLKSGTLVSHEMSYTEIAGCDRFRLEVYAEHGTVWLRTERGHGAIYAPKLTGEEDWVKSELDDEPLGEQHHRHWLEMIAGRSEPDDTPFAGYSTTAVAEAIYRAADVGCAVTIDPPGRREA